MVAYQEKIAEGAQPFRQNISKQHKKDKLVLFLMFVGNVMLWHSKKWKFSVSATNY